jgi:uncharacterized membrane protein
MTRRYYVIGILLTAATVVATFVVYPQLSDLVPTHWNLEGQPDDYRAKWTLFLIGPGAMAGLMMFFRFLPWLSPKHWEVDSFRATYLYIMLVLLCMVAYCHLLILRAGLGHAADVTRALLGGICLLFALLGNVLGKVRRNFYIGIRTPWALANERVWNSTHRFAAKTFVLCGLLGLVLTAIGLKGWPTFASLIAAALVPAVYSLVLYKQLERRGQL